jgi:hypothetical protein
MKTLLGTLFIPNKLQAHGKELATLLRPALSGNDAKKFDAAVAQFLDAVGQRARFVADQLQTLPATAAN